MLWASYNRWNEQIWGEWFFSLHLIIQLFTKICSIPSDLWPKFYRHLFLLVLQAEHKKVKIYFRDYFKLENSKIVVPMECTGSAFVNITLSLLEKTHNGDLSIFYVTK